MTSRELNDLRLDWETHSDRLHRALGAGGAPVDIDLARRLVPYLQGTLYRLLERLPKARK